MSCSSETVFVGIDFGTTKTMAARADPRSGVAIPLRLGRGNDETPTSIYEDEEGNRLFGDSADDEGVSDALNHATRFKMKLGQPGTAFTMRGNPLIARDLARDFLAYVRDYIREKAVHADVNAAVLTVPAIFGPAQRKDLKDAAKGAGFTKVELLDEPVAAAIGYCNRCPEQWDGQRLLVVDWGGGTLDIALVERRAGGEMRVHADFVSGLCDIGGEILDDDLWEVVSRRLATAGHGRLEEQAPENFGKYRRDLRLAKEQLSAKEHHTLQMIVAGGRHQKIDLSRSEFEEIISPRLERATALVKEIHARSLKEGCEPDFILLVGGTCRIPVVKMAIEQATGITCRNFDYGREAVALGAAYRAQATWGAQTKGSVPDIGKSGGKKSVPKKKRKSAPKSVVCPHCGDDVIGVTGAGRWPCPSCAGEVLVSCSCPDCGQEVEIKEWGKYSCPSQRCGTEFDAAKSLTISSGIGSVKCPHCGSGVDGITGSGDWICPSCEGWILISCLCPQCGQEVEIEEWGTYSCPSRRCGTEFDAAKSLTIRADEMGRKSRKQKRKKKHKPQEENPWPYHASTSLQTTSGGIWENVRKWLQKF